MSLDGGERRHFLISESNPILSWPDDGAIAVLRHPPVTSSIVSLIFASA
jgi:hypothetical protein